MTSAHQNSESGLNLIVEVKRTVVVLTKGLVAIR
jgi:hypothetical protein